MEKRMSGTIYSIKEKGFGFIQVNTNMKDNLFFHASDIVNAAFSELSIGDKVTFDKVATERGYAANNVELV